MTTPTYVSPFTGTVVQPTDVSYLALNFSSNTPLYWPAVVNGTQVAVARIIDATASTTGLSIFLPEADQGTVGTDILIRNMGSNTFTVNSYLEDNAVSIPAGTSKYFYLADNSTPDGIWNNVTFGTGTSFADAASLAGYGLSTTTSGTLATSNNIIQVSSSPVIAESSRASTYVWNSGAGSFTLPNYRSILAGWSIGFRNNGTGALTISPISPSTINGASSITVNPGDSGIIIYDVSSNNFFTVGWAVPNSITFSAGTYDVDSISGSALNLVANAPIIETYVALSGIRTTNLYVTLPAITQLYVFISEISSSAYTIILNVSGSTTSPIILNSGNIIIAGTDGGSIFAITAYSSTTFKASNGSASTPSISFLNDTTTGMYLQGVGVLGLSANQVEMLNLDNTNLLSPQVSTPATFTAKLIQGGVF
jgi:hypothetical protein